MNPIGKVLNKSTIREFNFVSNNYFQGQFVQIPVTDQNVKGLIYVGEIIDKEALNPYFEDPSVINYVGKRDDNLTSWTLYVNKTKLICIIDDDEIKSINFPPPPGANVYVADDDIIKRALGIDNSGINIGSLRQSRDIRICISENMLCKTHFTVLGRTGSGKTFFIKHLIKSIQDRIIVIFSPTGEYNDLTSNYNFKIASKEDLTLPFDDYLIASIFGLTSQERILFNNYFKKLNIKKKFVLSNYDIIDHMVSFLEIKPTQKKLLNAESDLFGAADVEINKPLDSIISKMKTKNLFFSNQSFKIPYSRSTIVDLSDIEQGSQEIIIKDILNNLLNIYRNDYAKKELPKLLIIFEESHNYAPSIQSTLCKNAIIQIAREGRKLGITLGLISQRPRHVDQTILSQCGSLFLFHIPNPDDIEHVFGISPIYRKDLVDIIRELAIGECLILGDVVKYPLLCQINFNN